MISLNYCEYKCAMRMELCNEKKIVVYLERMVGI